MLEKGERLFSYYVIIGSSYVCFVLITSEQRARGTLSKPVIIFRRQIISERIFRFSKECPGVFAMRNKLDRNAVLDDPPVTL